MAQLLALQGYGGYLSRKIAAIEVSSCKHLRSRALEEYNKDNTMHPDLYTKHGPRF